MRIDAGRWLSFRRLGALGTALILGCSEDATGPRPVPTAITVAAGGSQRGTVGQPLDTALTVFVTDKFGDPVPGVLVRFAVPRGAGTLEPLTQTTGPSGHAQSAWSLPTAAGTYTAVAAAAGLDSLTFRAQAVPAAPASLVLIEGDSQVASAAAALDHPVVVVVRDGYGNPVSGASVGFSVATGSGAVEPPAAKSDSVGRAETMWTLGADPGPQALVVKVDSLRPLRVRAKALSRPLSPLLGVTGFMGMGLGGSDPPVPGSVASGGRTLAAPTPLLRCWQNALGTTLVSSDPGDSTPDATACGEGLGL
jgi:hypothetical protein